MRTKNLLTKSSISFSSKGLGRSYSFVKRPCQAPRRCFLSNTTVVATVLLYNMYAEWMAALKEFAKVSQCSALFTIPWLFCDSNTPVGGLRKEWAFRETDLSLTRRQMEDIPFRSRVIYHWNSYFA